MNILILTKRQYMSKDLLDDRFGRFRELSLGLSNLGHNVVGLCLSYKEKQTGHFEDILKNTGAKVDWYSFNAGNIKPLGFIYYAKEALIKIKKFDPDIILAFSDTLYVILGVWLAKKTGKHSVIDLYDNFEYFQSSKIPGVLFLFRKAVKHADGITVVSNPLAGKISLHYNTNALMDVLVNGVRTDIFFPRDRTESRKHFKLPRDAQLIGFAGSLNRDRGVSLVFDGFKELSKEYKNLHLAVAGPLDRYTKVPKNSNIHYLGVLSLNEVPPLLSALDVAIICNRDNLFGRYCFPQKMYEIIACKIPLVAARVGAIEELMAGHPECMFDPNDLMGFMNAIRFQLKNPTLINIEVQTWVDLAKTLETFLLKVYGQDQING
jgi:glycosyltransferase involved in cell wall biosynthesis